MPNLALMDDFKQAIISQKKAKTLYGWEGNTLNYLEKVHESPDIATFAPGRIYNMIMKHGIESVPVEEKLAGYDDLVTYNFFKDKIFGLESHMAIHDIMKFLRASARRTETGKRILIMVGPVASGKSTIASLIKKGLEKDDTPMFAIKGCPINEEPLHVIPEDDRPFWEEKLGVKIEGHLCPHCRKQLAEDYTTDGVFEWENIPVVTVNPSEQDRIAIGTFQPSDPKSQDITELIGRVNMAKMTRFGETDPRAYQFDGELQVANRGLIEYIEILKADIKFHYVLISAAQEQVIKAPGFPQMTLDALILSHTNQTEYDSFKSDKKNEALHDRMYKVIVPWNLSVSEEVKIYQKMIAESDFHSVHIAPGTLELAAQFAVLSRLKKSTKVSSVVEKMKLYDGRTSNDFKKEEVDIRKIREEGRRNGEGMDQGISPRFIINALNVALASKEDKKCINPIDVIRALRQNFDHHTGIDEQDVVTLVNLLTGEKNSVASEFKEFAKKEVNMAFLYAYEDQATELFNRYMMNVGAYCRKEKVEDSVTGEYSSPDEKLMRSLEELIGVPSNSKDEFRNGVFVHKSGCLERGQEFTYESYAPIREAIEKKLMSDLRNVVNLSIVNTTSTNPKRQKARDRAFRTLLDKGYCEHCANMLLSFVGEILRKAS